MLKKQYDKPYKCNQDSIIFFGKYKGKKHEVLKEDKPYCEWILSTEEDFARETKVYIKENVLV